LNTRQRIPEQKWKIQTLDDFLHTTSLMELTARNRQPPSSCTADVIAAIEGIVMHVICKYILCLSFYNTFTILVMDTWHNKDIASLISRLIDQGKMRWYFVVKVCFRAVKDTATSLASFKRQLKTFFSQSRFRNSSLCTVS